MTCLLLLAPPTAARSPAFHSRVGGLALVGPTSPHPASGFYSPAALGLLRGHHGFFHGMLELALGRVRPAVIAPATAEATDALLPESTFTSALPSFFLAGISDLGSESVVVGLSLYNPATVGFSTLRGDGDFFDPAAQIVTGYHGTDLLSYHIFLTPAVAYRVIDEILVGLSFTYAFGHVEYGFVRDTALAGGRTLQRDAQGNYLEHAALDDCGNGAPCGYGARAAAEAVRVSGNSDGLAFGAGILVRPHPTLDVGFGFFSAVIGIGGGAIPAKGDAWVRRAQATLDNAQRDPAIDSVQRDLYGRGVLHYALPDILSAAATWRVTPPLSLNLQLRWLNYAVHDRLRIDLNGSQFRDQPQIPNSILIHQGLQDVFSAQLGAAYRLRPRIELQGAMMVESPRVAPAAVSVLDIEGWKIDGLIALHWTFHRYWTLRLGYGMVVMPSARVTDSDFNPVSMVECVDGSFDVDLEACELVAQGRGLASSAGEYAVWRHHFSLGLSLDVW